MKKILIEVDNIKVRAKLNDSKTAEKIWDLLPLEGKVNTWGDEIYFSIGAKIDLEQGASAVVSIGDLAYWPPGNAFCIFFGTTPTSIGAEIRAASAVNIFGHIIGDYEALKRVKANTSIIITKITN